MTTYRLCRNLALLLQLETCFIALPQYSRRRYDREASASETSDNTPRSAVLLEPEPDSLFIRDLSPEGLSFCVIASLFIFTIIGGFEVIAQTIACVRTHDETPTGCYPPPTSDDIDYLELLSNSSPLLISPLLKSISSLAHVRRIKDTTQWIRILGNGRCWCLANWRHILHDLEVRAGGRENVAGERAEQYRFRLQVDRLNGRMRWVTSVGSPPHTPIEEEI